MTLPRVTEPPRPPGVGDPAPGFISRNQFGAALDLADLSGAPAVLVFYPYAFTGICTSELHALQDLSAQFADRGARVVALSCDSMFTLRTFADTEGFTFDLVTDHWPHGAIASRYGVFDPERGCAVRGSFVLDAAGVVRWSVINKIGEARDIAAHLAALG